MLLVALVLVPRGAMKRLERVIAAGSAVIEIGVQRILASVRGLTAIGPEIDAATAVATAALARLVGAFQVAATELDVVVGEMLAMRGIAQWTRGKWGD